MQKWFYQQRGAEFGPLSGPELQYLASVRKISAETLVRRSDSAQWITFRKSELWHVPSRRARSMPISPPTADSKTSPQTIDTPAPITTVLTDEHTKPAEERSQPPEIPESPDDRHSGTITAAVCSVVLLLVLSWLISLWQNTAARSKTNPPAPQVAQAPAAVPAQKIAAPLVDEGQPAPATVPSDSSNAVDTTPITDSDQPEPKADPELPNSDETPVPAEMTIPESQETPPPPQVVSDPKPSESDEAALAAKFTISVPEKKEPRPRTRPSTRLKPIELHASDLTARSGEERQKAIEEGGGTAESERAVVQALNWLKQRQQEDGSWDFQAAGPQAQPGSLPSPLGATGMAMLCFLGAGNTTRNGPEQDVVRRAFNYIQNQEGRSASPLDTMYVHALVTMCLTELAAMEPGERAARDLATSAVEFIRTAQDPRSGGWRYLPRESGDTSVTGWQILALQSARTAEIPIDASLIAGADRFLDSVSSSQPGVFSYLPRGGRSPTMTAVALLCRMYLGHRSTEPQLQKGLEYLMKTGCSPRDMYYNYYATMALHHAGGTDWAKWNSVMRDQLINSQVKAGPAAGSWNLTDPHGGPGGQIYQTALSVLTLEVYYRYRPIAQRSAEDVRLTIPDPDKQTPASKPQNSEPD
ncbi:MAG: GYF domain-containing protein [Planctomycetaceae bacterium]